MKMRYSPSEVGETTKLSRELITYQMPISVVLTRDSHGRDHRLVVWQLRLEDEQTLASVSPLQLTGDTPPQPWMLHILDVNTMNFCAFAGCPNIPGSNTTLVDDSSGTILVAVPNALLAESVRINPRLSSLDLLLIFTS